MFNVKSLKKFVTVSASALMLISAGGGAVNAIYTNANAMSTSQIINMEKHMHIQRYGKNIDKRTAKQKAMDQQGVDYANKVLHDRGFQGKAHLTRHQTNKAVKNDNIKQKRQIKKNYRNHKVNANVRANRKYVYKSTKSKRVVKHIKRQKLQQQINGLKKTQNSLKHRISKATGRKYRTRRAKRNAKRYVNRLANQYIRNNSSIKSLTRQLKGNTKKVARRHAIRRHRTYRHRK